MGKLIAVVFLFVAALVSAALWFSPLSEIGGVTEYHDNMPVRESGLCYRADAAVRVETVGGEDKFNEKMRRLSARVVRRDDGVEGMTIFYMYSPRVAAECRFTRDGERYNVMVAVTADKTVMGTPIIEGSY